MGVYGVTRNNQTIMGHTISCGELSAYIIEYGATLVHLFVPSRNKRIIDAVLSYPKLACYEDGADFMGATIGRVAGHIKDAKYSLLNNTYHLDANSKGNCLNGGALGLSKKIFKTIALSNDSVTMRYDSLNGEDGFNGEVSITVKYTMTNSSLIIDYLGICKESTPLSIANHSYFDLSGGRGAANATYEHELALDSDKVLEIDDTFCATGKFLNADSVLNFNSAKNVGLGVDSKEPLVKATFGYDHTYVLNSGLSPLLELYNRKTGIVMSLTTDRPCLHLYTANYLNGENGLNRRSGICLIPQNYPNAVNVPSFVSSIYSPTRPFVSRSTYTFATRDIVSNRK